MNRTFRSILVALFVAASGFVATPVSTPALAAQATINTTTLSAAVSATQTSFAIASATTVAAGQVVYVDHEMMLVTALSGTTLTVQRGYNATVGATHASGSLIYTGPPNYFSQNEVAGSCDATAQVALPHVVPASGNVYQCTDSIWVRWATLGVNQFSAGGSTTYTTSGAITVKPGVSLIGSAGGLSMTLATPTLAQNGMTMSIFASTAQAHTITTTAGFNGGTTSRDVCTLGGAIGDGIVIQAWGGVWYVIANRNCTLA